MPETPITFWPLPDLDPDAVAAPLSGQAQRVFRNHVTEGDPASGIHLPPKEDVIALMRSLENLLYILPPAAGAPAAGALGIPMGTSAERPVTNGPGGAVPSIRFNTELGRFEGWNPNAQEWQELSLATGAPVGPTGVYLADFPMDPGSPQSGFYGQQAGIVIAVDLADGSWIASTYLDLNNKYTFIRGMDIAPDGRLVLGQSRLGANPQGTEISLAVMPGDLTQLAYRYGFGDTTTPPANPQDGQPGVVINGSTVYCAFTTSAPVTASPGGGHQPAFGGGQHNRLVVTKFSLAALPGNALTLQKHTYVRPVEPTNGQALGETHPVALFPNGNVLIAGETTRGAVLPVPGGAADPNPAPDPGRKGFFLIYDEDLDTVLGGTYWGGGTAGNDLHFDGADVSPDGSLYGTAFVTNNSNFTTTDGSALSLTGYDGGGVLVMNDLHQVAFCSIVAQPTGANGSNMRRLRFDDEGNFYCAGWEALTGPHRTQATVWKFEQTGATGGTFARSGQDARFASPNLSTLGYEAGLVLQFDCDFDLDASMTLMEYDNTAIGKVKALWDTAGTLFLTVNGAAAVSFALGLPAPTDVLTLTFSNEPGLCIRAYKNGTLVATTPVHASANNFNGAFPLYLLAGITSDFVGRAVKVWESAAGPFGATLPALGTPVVEINASNANSHAWKIGAAPFTITPGTAADFTLAWKRTFPVASGSGGQIRGIEPLPGGAGVLVSGALATNYTGGYTHYHETPGGEHGSGSPLQAFMARLDAATGAPVWISGFGGVEDYDRLYDVDVNIASGVVYGSGRAGGEMLTGRA